jgi:hypothetical protein
MENTDGKDLNSKELKENIMVILRLEMACVICARYIEKYGLSELVIEDVFGEKHDENDLHSKILEYIKTKPCFDDVIDIEKYKSYKASVAESPGDEEQSEFLNNARIVLSYEESCNYLSVIMKDWGTIAFSEFEEYEPEDSFADYAEVIIKVSELIEKFGQKELAYSFRCELLKELLEEKKHSELVMMGLIDKC